MQSEPNHCFKIFVPTRCQVLTGVIKLRYSHHRSTKFVSPLFKPVTWKWKVHVFVLPKAKLGHLFYDTYLVHMNLC